MKAIIKPQFSTHEAAFSAEGDKLTVTVDGQTEVFDFTGMPDGHANDFATSLPVNPVLSAKRQNGELTVTLIGFYGEKPEPLEPDYIEGEDGEEVPVFKETDEEYAARVEAWEALTKKREVEL